MISLDRKPDIYLTQAQFDKLKTGGKLEIGSTYHITDAKAVFTVNGKFGDVEITKEDVGLSNVDNTSDTEKNVLSATKLTTARKINGVDFDGTEDITVVDNTAIHKTGDENKTGSLFVYKKLSDGYIYGVSVSGNGIELKTGEPYISSTTTKGRFFSAGASETALETTYIMNDRLVLKLSSNDVTSGVLGGRILPTDWSGQQGYIVNLGSTRYPFNNLYLKGKLNKLTLPDKEDTIATLSDLAGGANKTLSLSINGGEAITYDGSTDVAFDVSLSALGGAKDSEVVHTNSDSTISEHKLVLSKSQRPVSAGVTPPQTLTLDGSGILFKASQLYPNAGGLYQSSDGEVTLSATKWVIDTAGSSGFRLRNNEVVPWNRSETSFDMNLGSSAIKFNNLYLKGKINNLTLPDTAGTLATLSDIITNYDNLSNKPVENVDLSSSTILAGVIANTYYRHVGDSTESYTKGTIYYYNGTDFKEVGAVGKKGTGEGSEIFNDYINTALGSYSHAEGSGTAALGNYSHAEGKDTIASSNYGHAQGIFNLEDKEKKYAHIVGNGTGLYARSNAHTLDWSGNAWFAGKVSGGTEEHPAAVDKANDYVTKKYFDTNKPADALEVRRVITLTSAPAVNATLTLSSEVSADTSLFNRTPVVGDGVFAVGDYNGTSYMLALDCISLSAADLTATFRINSAIELNGGGSGGIYVLNISTESSVTAGSVRAAINAFNNNQVVLCRMTGFLTAVLLSVMSTDVSENGDGSAIDYSLMFIANAQGTVVKFALELPTGAADSDELPFVQTDFGVTDKYMCPFMATGINPTITYADNIATMTLPKTIVIDNNTYNFKYFTIPLTLRLYSGGQEKGRTVFPQFDSRFYFADGSAVTGAGVSVTARTVASATGTESDQKTFRAVITVLQNDADYLVVTVKVFNPYTTQYTLTDETVDDRVQIYSSQIQGWF